MTAGTTRMADRPAPCTPAEAAGRPPVVVAWEVTRACPLACRHCRAEAQHRPHAAELTFDEGRTLMDDLAREFPGAVLILTGGEPLVRPDVLALAEDGSRLGLSMALSVDVGRLLTPDTCRRIRAAGIRRVSFSLHFPDASRSDAFARRAGFFEAALAGLANLRRAGVPFQLHTTVMSANVALLPRIYELAAEIGADGWELFFLVPTGRARLLQGQELSAGEQERLLRWLYRVQRRSEFPVKQICAPHFRRIEAQTARARGERRSEQLTSRLSALSRGCLAGNGFAFVSHVGDVCGCGFLPLSVGNVRDQAFSELYRGSPLFAAFRDAASLRGACGACEYAARCGGCRARAYAATGDPLAEEPDCAYSPGPRSTRRASGATRSRPQEREAART